MEKDYLISRKNKQVKAILEFQHQLSREEGRKIPLYEAIANWIALGYAEQFRQQVFKLQS
ncbi:hypothetical protein DRQ09_09785 [candidate division KSB1 bacterium]|mgnify:CR=1 FL=1|nr:MAG: hypothetical protein DRQ09_09785 [candidate division KSB1 bacterium]